MYFKTIYSKAWIIDFVFTVLPTSIYLKNTDSHVLVIREALNLHTV